MGFEKRDGAGFEFNKFVEGILENYDEFYESMKDMINHIGGEISGQENILEDVTSMATAMKNCFLKVLSFLEDGNLDEKGLQTELNKIKIIYEKFDVFEKMNNEEFIQLIYSLGKEKSKGFLKLVLVLHRIQNINENKVVMDKDKLTLKSLIDDINDAHVLLKS